MYERTDIKQCDVFLSWTGKDKEIKEKVQVFLESKGLSCLESDESCSGDYRLWSREAVSACSIFVPIITENSINSTYMPLEVDEAKKYDDYLNRIVPICVNNDFYAQHSFELNKFCSAVFINDLLSHDVLECLYNKIKSLLINRYFIKYNEHLKPAYMNVNPLLPEIKKTSKYAVELKNLYIERTLSILDINGDVVGQVDSMDRLLSQEQISFIFGASGSGKTQQLQYISTLLHEDSIPFIVVAEDFSNCEYELFDYLYMMFCNVIGKNNLYSKDNFSRLLETKKIILMVDGLDEVPTDKKKKLVINKINKFCKPIFERTSLIYTSRNRDDVYNISFENKHITSYELNLFAEEDTRNFIDKLFLVLAGNNAEEEFVNRIFELEKNINSNPLLIIQLVIIYNQYKTIPKNRYQIMNSVSQLIAELENSKEFVQDGFVDDLNKILTEYSYKKYLAMSDECDKSSINIIKDLFETEMTQYRGNEDRFCNYLEEKTIWENGKFYHKMLLEYYAASALYNRAYDDRGRLINPDIIEEIFSKESDFWNEVIVFFLEEADLKIGNLETEKLYNEILKFDDKLNFDLLFNTSKELIKNKEQMLTTMMVDMIYKSSERIYPPYGPMFYYIPEYGLYKEAVKALMNLKGNEKAFALVRDVCFILGHYDTCEQIVSTVNSKELFDSIVDKLYGVRKALCELFFIGKTTYEGGKDIYPRCFNVADTIALSKTNASSLVDTHTLYEDELNLFNSCNNERFRNEHIGCVFTKYVNRKFTSLPKSKKITCLFVLDIDEDEINFVNFYRKKVKAIFFSKNISFAEKWDLYFDLNIQYINESGVYCRKREDVLLPNGIKKIPALAFANQSFLKTISIPEGVEEISGNAFKNCTNLKSVTLPDSLSVIKGGAFADCSSLETIKFPDKLRNIGGTAFSKCSKLKLLQMPKFLKEIGNAAFEHCYELKHIEMNHLIEKVGSSAFNSCYKLEEIHFTDSIKKIGGFAFANCINLTCITLPKDNCQIGIHWNDKCDKLKIIYI